MIESTQYIVSSPHKSLANSLSTCAHSEDLRFPESSSMTPSELNIPNELLRSIADSLKDIQSSLHQLTGAVESVSESIERAHEPEGDLGVHLVGALKDLTSVLHKRAQQERLPQAQQRSHLSLQNRRDDHSRSDHRMQQGLPPQERSHDLELSDTEVIASHDNITSSVPITTPSSTPQNPQRRLSQGGAQPRKPRPNQGRQGGRGGKIPPTPQSPLPEE